MTRLPSLGSRGQGWVMLQVALLALVVLVGVVSGPAWGGLLAFTTAALGLLAMLGGAALIIRGLWDLGPDLTPMPYPRHDAKLIQHGAYALVRHPLYGGLVVLALGWGVLAASPATIALALLLGVFFDLKSRREEAWLLQRHREYAAYMARTRRLIPWVY